MSHSRAWSACPPSPPPNPNAAGTRASERSTRPPAGGEDKDNVAQLLAAITREAQGQNLSRSRGSTSLSHPSPPKSSTATPSPSSSRCRTAGDKMDAATMSLAALAMSQSSNSSSGGSGSARDALSLSLQHHSQTPSQPIPANSHSSHLSNSISQVAPVNIPAQALSPPTPAPSPTPTERWSYASLQIADPEEDDSTEAVVPSSPTKAQKPPAASDLITRFRTLPKNERFAFLSTLVGELQLNEALVLSSRISPKLKRDFLADLPIELALHCVSFIDDARTLGQAMRVSKYWHDLLQDERLWRDMHERQLYRPTLPAPHAPCPPPSAVATANPTSRAALVPRPLSSVRRPPQSNTYREKFRDAYLTESNWLNGGRLLTMHCSTGDSVVTSLVVNDQYIVIGMANSKIHVFDAATGHFRLSLIGHELGVWALVLVSPPADGDKKSYAKSKRDDGSPRRASFGASQDGGVPTKRSNSSSGEQRSEADNRHAFGGSFDTPRASSSSERAERMPSSDVCGSAKGWGVQRTLVVSGGCDREVRVWDIVTGQCIYALRGHSSTIRCLKVLDGRPIAISGSRDFTLRVWDIDRGRMLRVLEGHEQSVRCIEVAGNKVVSGSYDYTCRLWDIDTGECLQVFQGHYCQIYAVAFDGERVVSGSLDSTVRVWDAASGECLAALQGHTSLVGQLQLSGDRLITGGSDGRVIVFDLNDYSCVYRLCAHDNSVTCLQFDDRFIVSGGNDGRVKLWDLQTGTIIRELTRPCDAVWRVCFRNDKCAILCQRNGKTVLEVLGFRPHDENLKPSFSRSPDW